MRSGWKYIDAAEHELLAIAASIYAKNDDMHVSRRRGGWSTAAS